ncbi:thiamine phosphate synthase [Shewanella surugensis]|uniref:Thiamine-phosphate synthase n=1 Tax=Shewanella surugensis TaxID=212020 RepID=A0ABT0LF97_9GAMM|nr:thiamine phosphate synthase [Shewanella surugensis]MCL1126335.1 thiamine phosphate synthase [Shewanella surugensis]
MVKAHLWPTDTRSQEACLDRVPIACKSTACQSIVWSIAGSDSGGGAGIQADLATMQDLGCHPCSVITTITAQSSVEVSLVEGVSNAMLLAQLNTLLTDLPPKVIKIGLLASQEQLERVANWLTVQLAEHQRQTQIRVAVILDPVMLASCGDALNAQKALNFDCFKGLLTLLTPNATELALLVEQPLPNASACLHAAKQLATRLDCAVLAKGGDQGGTWDPLWAHDVFVCGAVPEVSLDHQNACFLLTNERVNTHNNHGTGCTLSSAIAAIMASGFVLHDAIVVAKAYVSAGLKASYQPGSGAGVLTRLGWPSTLSDFPSIVMLANDETTPHDGHQYMTQALVASRYHALATYLDFEPVSLRQIAKPFTPIKGALGLYPVVDDNDMLARLLAAGTQTVQLRLKDLSRHDLEAQIEQAVALGKQYKARVFINDHWQLAIKHGAYGVHLGQEDLLVADLVAIANANMALGLSSHSYFELILASQLAPSYLALGHIFPTTTKVMPSLPQGLNKLSRYVSLMKGHFPLVAIGGIDETRLEQVKATGVDDIAVVRAVTQAASPADAFVTLSQRWAQA